MMKNFSLKFFGCKLNQHEAETTKEQLINAGWQFASIENSSVLLVFGCAVTGKAEAKLRQFISKTHSSFPQLRIFLCGCIATAIEKQLCVPFEHTVHVSYKMRFNILQFIDTSSVSTKLQNVQPESLQFPRITGANFERTRATVKIQDGCDNLCAYCIVPLLRGKSVSCRSEYIIEQISNYISSGFTEITITGVNIAAYSYRNLNFTQLLCSIIDNFPNINIRLSSIEPFWLTNDLCEIIGTLPQILPHLHIPIQSGSQKVLASMNRMAQNNGQLISQLSKLRSLRPDICFGTDIIVGFPMETDADFAQTQALLSTSLFAYTHIFRFSPRKGTHADKLKLLSNNIVTQRAKILALIDEQNRLEFANKFLNTSIKFIAEKIENGAVTGKSGNYIDITASFTGENCPISKGDNAICHATIASKMALSGILVLK